MRDFENSGFTNDHLSNHYSRPIRAADLPEDAFRSAKRGNMPARCPANDGRILKSSRKPSRPSGAIGFVMLIDATRCGGQFVTTLSDADMARIDPDFRAALGIQP